MSEDKRPIKARSGQCKYLTQALHCTLHTAYCTLHTVHYTLHTAHCKLPTALNTTHCVLLHSAQFTLHTLNTSNCTLHTAQFTLHTEHCTLQHTALTGAYLASLRYLHAPPLCHICKHCHCTASGPQGPLGMPQGAKRPHVYAQRSAVQFAVQ